MIVLSAEADKLLDEMKEKGIKLSLNKGKLSVEGQISGELRETTRKNEDGLIQLVELGEHQWQGVAVWEYRREGNEMRGMRLDGPGKTSWTIDVEDQATEVQ